MILGLDYIKFSEKFRTSLGFRLRKVLRKLLNWVSGNLWIVVLLLVLLLLLLLLGTYTLDHLSLGDQGMVLGPVWGMVTCRVIDMLGNMGLTVLSRLVGGFIPVMSKTFLNGKI